MTTVHVPGNQVAAIAGPVKLEVNGSLDAPHLAALVAPTAGSLSPNTAVAGAAAAVNMTVTGTNFNEWSKIVFNGHDEPTTLLSPTTVRTIVQPSLFTVAAVCPVAVRNGSLVSNSVNFTFTATELAADEEEVEEDDAEAGTRRTVRRKKR